MASPKFSVLKSGGGVRNSRFLEADGESEILCSEERMASPKFTVLKSGWGVRNSRFLRPDGESEVL